MRVLRQKYLIDGKLFDEVQSQLNDLKEGVVVQSVFVVEDVVEGEDKSGVKTAQKGDEPKDDPKEEDPKEEGKK